MIIRVNNVTVADKQKRCLIQTSLSLSKFFVNDYWLPDLAKLIIALAIKEPDIERCFDSPIGLAANNALIRASASLLPSCFAWK